MPPLPKPHRAVASTGICLLAALIVSGTFFATLTPMPYDRQPPDAPLIEGYRHLSTEPTTPADAAGNVALFVPVGVALWSLLRVPLRLRFATTLLAVMLGAVMSTAIEWLQVFVPGRYPSIIDIACNTAGAYIGAAGASVATALACDFLMRYAEWLRRRESPAS